MSKSPKATVTSILLAACGVMLAASQTFAQDRAMARMLQSLDQDFDRHGLEADIVFQGDDGTLRPGVRCATRPVADFEQQFVGAAIAEHLRTAGLEHRAKTLEIPVRFHILRRRNGAYEVTDAQIAAQLDVLNSSFAQHGFSFRLDGVSRRAKNRFVESCSSSRREKRLKKKYAVDPSTTLNIYSCRPSGGTLGYAYYPSDYPEDSVMHGVVLLHSTFPGSGAAPFDMGDTAVHEVGHYLGLLHTFENRCGKKGDRIADTPRERTPAYGCPLGRDTCSQPGLDPIHNFMDYVEDECMDEFTADQKTRMQDQVETFKPRLGGS